MSYHSPYTILVAEYDKFHYVDVDVDSEEQTLKTFEEEFSRQENYCCIAYYWSENLDCYVNFLEKHK